MSLALHRHTPAASTDWAEGRPRPVQRPLVIPAEAAASTDWAEGRPRPVQRPLVIPAEAAASTDWAEGRPRPVHRPEVIPAEAAASTDWAEGRPRPVQRPQVFSLSRTVLLIFAMLLTACHSTKHVPGGGDVDTNISDGSTTELYESLAASYGTWSDLYVPVTLALESPKRMSISGRATMIYGEAINISLRVLGIEAGVVYIDTETMWVVDKYHKKYYRMDIGRYLQAYGLTLSDLQDLLLGRAVLPGQGVIKADDPDGFSFLSADDHWILTPVKKAKGADWHYIASKTEPPLLTALSMRIAKMGALQCLFSEPTNTPAGIVDALTTLIVPYKDADISVSVAWRLDEAKWDTQREIRFSPPGDSYKLIDIESILSSGLNL